jgi:RNA polymerase sigma-70 factor (ECF subfamily)
MAMRDGPQAGLQALEPLMEDATLRDYHLAHAARADMHRRLGQREPARSAYQAALDRATQPAEQRFLRQRLAELG